MHPKLVLIRKWEQDGQLYVMLGDKATGGNEWCEIEIMPIRKKKGEKDEVGAVRGNGEGEPDPRG